MAVLPKKAQGIQDKIEKWGDRICNPDIGRFIFLFIKYLGSRELTPVIWTPFPCHLCRCVVLLQSQPLITSLNFRLTGSSLVYLVYLTPSQRKQIHQARFRLTTNACSSNPRVAIPPWAISSHRLDSEPGACPLSN